LNVHFKRPHSITFLFLVLEKTIFLWPSLVPFRGRVFLEKIKT
jgi:hypothetical protein